MGWHTQPTCAVHFDGVALPAAGGLLGEEGRGFSYAMRALNGGRLSIAACSLGAAAACLDAAAAYTRERRQFGRPLAAFQATRFKLAAAATRLAHCRVPSLRRTQLGSCLGRQQGANYWWIMEPRSHFRYGHSHN